MPKINEAYPVAYSFSEEELREARLLPPLIKMHIATLIAEYSAERNTLEIQHEFPNAERSFMLASSKLLGAIQALNHLLALSELAEAEYSAANSPNITA